VFLTLGLGTGRLIGSHHPDAAALPQPRDELPPPHPPTVGGYGKPEM